MGSHFCDFWGQGTVLKEGGKSAPLFQAKRHVAGNGMTAAKGMMEKFTAWRWSIVNRPKPVGRELPWVTM